MVTVLDGHPHSLSFLATINRVEHVALGVSEFGQSGDIGDVHRHHGIDADAIVRLAKDAGQRYIVITAKHHDGYAMWPTRQNTWNLRDQHMFETLAAVLATIRVASSGTRIDR